MEISLIQNVQRATIVNLIEVVFGLSAADQEFDLHIRDRCPCGKVAVAITNTTAPFQNCNQQISRNTRRSRRGHLRPTCAKGFFLLLQDKGWHS